MPDKAKLKGRFHASHKFKEQQKVRTERRKALRRRQKPKRLPFTRRGI